jgi:hypothetical protein
MTKVFVHGNPETTAVWEPLLPAPNPNSAAEGACCMEAWSGASTR